MNILSAANFTGFQALNLRVHNVTSPGDVSNPGDGVLTFWSAINDKRLAIYDSQLSAHVKLPRLDRAESVVGQWTFAPTVAQAPFVLNANALTQLVTGLNADLLDGAHADAAATSTTVILRDAGGRGKIGYPVASDDIANKQYVLDQVAGLLVPLAAVRILATGNVNIGSPPVNNNAIWDGLTVATGDRIGLVFQTTGSQNGVYTATVTGSAVSLTRSTDFDTDAEVNPGANFLVTTGGTVWGGTRWQLTTPDPITLGTTTLTFVQIQGATSFSGGPGIGINGNEIYVKLGVAGSPQGYAYTASRVVYTSSTSALNFASSLAWDNTNGRLGIGQTTPTQLLHVESTGTDCGIRFSSGSSALYDAFIQLGTNTRDWKIFALRSANLYDFVISYSGTDAPLANILRLKINGEVLTRNSITLETPIGWKVNPGSGTVSQGEFQIVGVVKGLVGMTTATTMAVELHSSVSGTLALRAGGANILTVSSSGATNLPNLSASSVVFTDGSKNLTSSGSIGVTQGGTGTTTQFTPGSIVFAGASGVYSQDNANLFWDDTNNRLGIITATPEAPFDIRGTLQVGRTANATSGTTTVNGHELAFQSSRWNGAAAVNTSMRVKGYAVSTTSYALSIVNDTGGEYFRITEAGLITLFAVAASSIVQTNGSNQLFGSNSLPSNTTINGVSLTRRISANITGNGALTSFDVTHSFGTQNVVVTVWDDVLDQIAYVDVNNKVGDLTNAVTVTFGAAVGNGVVYRVVIVG